MTRMLCLSLAALPPAEPRPARPECAIISWGWPGVDWDHRYMADTDRGANVMPAVVEPVKHYASVGELTKCLVDVYGRDEEPICL